MQQLISDLITNRLLIISLQLLLNGAKPVNAILSQKFMLSTYVEKGKNILLGLYVNVFNRWQNYDSAVGISVYIERT